jgi:hypothetical protein
MSARGYAMVEGHRFGVTGISLAGGKILLRVTRRGPAPAFDGPAAVTVFGEDDLGICQGNVHLDYGEVGEREALTVTINMKMDKCFGDAEEQ